MKTERGLAGLRVIVTRPAGQAHELSELLQARGAIPAEVPVIEFVEPADGGLALRDAVAEVAGYDWVVLTSPNGAKRFCRALGDPVRSAGPQVAAIGSSTAGALEAFGLTVALLPDRQVAEGLLAAFPDPPGGGGRLLLVRAADARDVFPEGARARGWEVDDVAAYQTVPAQISDAQRQAVVGADVVTFTSSSTVTHFVAAVGATAVPPVVACIGPATAATARELGLTVSVEATDHSLEGLVAALTAHFGQPGH